MAARKPAAPRKPRKTAAPKPAEVLRVATSEAKWAADGSVDVWPILAASAPSLVSEIESGAHDAIVGDLYRSEQAQQARADVLAACEARKG